MSWGYPYSNPERARCSDVDTEKAEVEQHQMILNQIWHRIDSVVESSGLGPNWSFLVVAKRGISWLKSTRMSLESRFTIIFKGFDLMAAMMHDDSLLKIAEPTSNLGFGRHTWIHKGSRSKMPTLLAAASGTRTVPWCSSYHLCRPCLLNAHNSS